jgi:Tol biopolymer transport system component
MKTVRSAIVTIGVTAAAILAGGVPGAQAAFPGGNGKIAFTSDQSGGLEIYTMAANGGVLRRLTDNNTPDDSPSFSANGTRIVFIRTTSGDRDVWRMSSDGKNQVRLTNNGAADDTPSFSPGGSKVVFTRYFSDGDAEIMAMSDDGAGVTRLTTNSTDDSDPVFSPDGSKIAYTCEPEAGRKQVCVMNADGTGVTVVPGCEVDSCVQPDWSPDGASLAYSRWFGTDFWASNASAVYTQPVAGGAPVRLTAADAWVNGPVYSPSGTKIVYSIGPQPENIYTMNADGTGQTNVTSTPNVDEWGADWQAT